MSNLNQITSSEISEDNLEEYKKDKLTKNLAKQLTNLQNIFKPLITLVQKDPSKLIALLMPFVIAIVGHLYTSAIKEKEIQTKYIEIATDILKEEPSKYNQNMREWSLNIINHYAPITINKQTRSEFINRGIYRSYNKERLQKLSKSQRLKEQIGYTKGWLKRYNLKVSDFKKALSKAGYFKKDINSEILDQDVIDAVILLQESTLSNPDDIDGICGEICFHKLEQIGVLKEQFYLNYNFPLKH
ncbi:MAG TPA: hypothetical protein DCF68_15735 [Cyanothece sp. UBA12306]|nr:hypothetical protein [Cyanothece sp. UBA12306]